MEFKVSVNLVWVLCIANLAVFNLAILSHWGQYSYATTVSMAYYWLQLTTLVIVVADMISRKLYQKFFWIVSTFVLPFLTPIFYLIQRDRLLRLAAKKKQEKYR